MYNNISTCNAIAVSMYINEQIVLLGQVNLNEELLVIATIISSYSAIDEEKYTCSFDTTVPQG